MRVPLEARALSAAVGSTATAGGWFGAAMIVIWLSAAGGAAQDAQVQDEDAGQEQQDFLAAAEEAYLEVNFEQTLEAARQALERGGYDPQQVERIHRLIGIAAAATGDDAAARDAYVRMFALNPRAEADENLSPRLRQPFMEALGQWTARQSAFRIEGRRLRESRGLGLALEDPLGMAERVVVHTRVPNRSSEYARTELAAAEPLLVPIEGLSEYEEVEYYARVLDAYGNRLLELGSSVEPESLPAREREVATASTDPVPFAEAEPAGEAEPTAGGSGVDPWLFAVSGGLTLVSAGVLAWSIADVVTSHDDYLAAPTEAKYLEGLELQTRTNVLIGVTAGLGVVTALVAIFTNWSGGPPSTDSARGPRWMLFASPTSVGGGIAEHF